MTYTNTTMDIMFLTHSHRLGHALYFLQSFSPIRGYGAIAVVTRGNGKWCCGLGIHPCVGVSMYAEPVVWAFSSVFWGGD